MPLALSTVSAALSLVKGVSRIGKEIDTIASENVLSDSKLVMPIPEVSAPSLFDLEDLFNALLALKKPDGSPQLDASDRKALSKALENPFQAPMQTLYCESFVGIAYQHGLAFENDKTFFDKVAEKNPDWVKDPAQLNAAYYISASRDPDSPNKSNPVWRVTRVLLDLFSDFAASQIGLFVKDPKLQPVIQSVLKNFGDADIDQKDFKPSEVLRTAFTSTINGVIDSRASLGQDNRWVTAFLDGFGDMREELNKKKDSGFDNYLIGLFDGQGYQRLLGTLIKTTAGELGEGTDDVVKIVSADYLKKVAGLIEESQASGNTELEGFIRSRWGDLLRGAFSSLSDNTFLLLGDDAGPLTTKIVGNVLTTISKQEDASFRRFANGDVLAAVANAAVKTVAENKELLGDHVDEPWFQDLIVQTSRLVADRGIRQTLTADGLSALTKDVISQTASTIAENPDLLGDAISEKWLRAMVSGSLQMISTNGLAPLLTPDGAKKLLQSTLQSGAKALLANPELLKIDEEGFKTLVLSASKAFVQVKADALFTKDGVSRLMTDFIDSSLTAAAENPDLISKLAEGAKMQAILVSILQSAKDTSVTQHFTKDGLRDLLGTSITSLSANPQVILADGAPKGTSALVGGILEAIGKGISSKATAQELAKASLSSALATLSQNPELLSAKYPKAISTAVGSIASLVETGKLAKPLATQLLDLLPEVLLENPHLFSGKYAPLAATILDAVLNARDLARTDLGDALASTSVILNKILVETARSTLTAIAANTAARFEIPNLSLSNARTLLVNELQPLLAGTLELTVQKIGKGISTTRKFMKTTRAYHLLFAFIVSLSLQSCSFSGSNATREVVDETNGAFAELVTNKTTGGPYLPAEANKASNSSVEANLKKAIADARSDVAKTQLQFRLALYHTLRGTGGNVINDAWAPVAKNTRNLPSRERIITDSRTALIFWYGDGIGALQSPSKGIYHLDETGTPIYARDILGVWPKNTSAPDPLPTSFQTAGYNASPVGQAEKGLREALKANNKNLAFYFAVLMDDMILKTYNTGALRKATDYWTSLLIQADKLSRQAFSADDLANYNSPSSDPATQ
ncbi:hypothetical protein N9A86_04680, partial [Akkermansiaceae bacterium]|nr:hypothetical protein [Akkermansiaceae bacterium]